MTKAQDKEMHVVCLAIDTSAYERQLMDRSFHALSHIHNVLVQHVRKLITRLEHDGTYQSIWEEYATLLKKKKLSAVEKEQKKVLSVKMREIRRDIGLSEYGFQSYIRLCAKQYTKLLSSQQVQKEASRIWASVEKYLFGNGKSVHFKKYRDLDTIGGKSNLNGMRFDKETFTATWMKHEYRIKRPKCGSERYVYEALESEISYCDIKRVMFPNGWRYYISIVLKGPAPKKLTPGDKVCGIDPGVSTVAAVSEDRAFLEELAPEIEKYNREICKLQRHMDISKRKSNPGKYKPDGTINRTNCDHWTFSKTYLKMRQKLKFLYGRKSRYIKQSHNTLINRMLADAKYFLVESMDYKKLARRSSKTERAEKESNVKSKDNTVTKVRKYKRKKRFGKSLGNRAPALFLRLLRQKATLYGGCVAEIDTKSFRASQYDHVRDTYQKVPLSQRFKDIGGHRVQRDLYSAFLILHADEKMKHTDREKCLYTFEKFADMQDRIIADMKTRGISMPQCFGF